jgi:hypothetical protein
MPLRGILTRDTYARLEIYFPEARWAAGAVACDIKQFD